MEVKMYDENLFERKRRKSHDTMSAIHFLNEKTNVLSVLFQTNEPGCNAIHSANNRVYTQVQTC
eukprot:m.193621 g.193621  ORF g.193621 m.193621 type:complete len:64 (-) comp13656_c0_seq6:3179-3370(-)